MSQIFKKEKRPRVYAAEIRVLTTVEQRKAALEQVPENLRLMIEDYVRVHFTRRKIERKNNE